MASSSKSSSAENWFVTSANGDALELSLTELTTALETGKVLLSALVWRSGMSGWLELDQVPLMRMVVAQLDLSRIPPEIPALAPADFAVFDALEEADATVVQPAPILSINADDRFEAVSATAPPAQAFPPLLDDDDLTIVTQAPSAPTLLGIANLAVVSQPSPVVSLNDDDWTVEPARGPAPPAIQPALSIHALAQKGTLSEQTTGSELARPQLARPVLLRPFSTSTPPAEKRTESVTEKPSLSERAPPKPHPSQAPEASHNSRLPTKASPVAASTGAPSVEPRVSGPAGLKSPESKSTPVARANSTSASHLSPGRPRVSPASSNSQRGSPGDSRSLRPGADSSSNRKLAPSVASSRPQPVKTAAASPIGAVSTASSNRVVVAQENSTPPRLPASQVAASAASLQVAPKPMASASAPAPPVLPVSEPLTSVPGLSAKPFTVELSESNEGAGSLAPSMRSFSPDMPDLRPSRRPLYVAVAAMAAAATLIFVFSVSSPTRKRSVVAAKTLPPHPALTETTRVREPAPVVAARATPGPEPTAPPPSATEAQSKAPAPPTASPRKASSAVKIADAAANKLQPRSIEAPVAKRRVPEIKPAATESSAIEKSPGSSSKKGEATAPSVASWDQGTVERRSWMSPGF